MERYEAVSYTHLHRQQQLTEILRLRRRLFAEDTAGYLRQAVHDLGDLLAKHVLNILDRIFGILHQDVYKRQGSYLHW